MSSIKHSRPEELPAKHKHEQDSYEYVRKKFVARGEAASTLVSIYEIPPMKSAYPYHYHLKDEETFYIISGELLFFPAGSGGAHKLTNTSATEKLVYIDFDVIHDLDVAVYPDSGKIGVWGKGVNRVYHLDDNADYYDGE